VLCAGRAFAGKECGAAQVRSCFPRSWPFWACTPPAGGPPVALLRRMGFRTQKEIQAERELVEASLGNGIVSKDRRMADV